MVSLITRSASMDPKVSIIMRLTCTVENVSMTIPALLHWENMSVKCIPPLTPLLYRKTGVCRGIPNFLIFDPKHIVLILVRTASARRF